MLAARLSFNSKGARGVEVGGGRESRRGMLLFLCVSCADVSQLAAWCFE